jgi:hypothetical protein
MFGTPFFGLHLIYSYVKRFFLNVRQIRILHFSLRRVESNTIDDPCKIIGVNLKFNKKTDAYGRHIINEKQWNSWIDFYNETNLFLNGREICDCFRDNSDLSIPFEDGFYENKVYNFRIYLNHLNCL